MHYFKIRFASSPLTPFLRHEHMRIPFRRECHHAGTRLPPTVPESMVGWKIAHLNALSQRLTDALDHEHATTWPTVKVKAHAGAGASGNSLADRGRHLYRWQLAGAPRESLPTADGKQYFESTSCLQQLVSRTSNLISTRMTTVNENSMVLKPKGIPLSTRTGWQTWPLLG